MYIDRRRVLKDRGSVKCATEFSDVRFWTGFNWLRVGLVSTVINRRVPWGGGGILYQLSDC
jgi:hypothetical protein